MKKILPVIFLSVFIACNNDHSTKNNSTTNSSSSSNVSGHWDGAFTNGMKETYISFDISDDGKEVQNLTFKGYWRCDGKLEQTTLGPAKSFPVTNNKIDGIITDPEDGGATAIRYELHGTINGNQAEGTFRMNINALACDTHLLNWTANKK